MEQGQLERFTREELQFLISAVSNLSVSGNLKDLIPLVHTAESAVGKLVALLTELESQRQQGE